jgi:hypothetical protein
MVIKVKINKIFIGFLCIAPTFTTFAGIEGFSFPDSVTTGGNKEVSFTEKFINPHSELNFVVSAGLDRKVRVTISNSSGAILDTITSNVISVSDRIKFFGREFYGKSLKSKIILVDGNYSYKTELLDVNNETISVEEKDFTIDKTPPSIGDWYATGDGSYGRVAGTTSANWLLGSGGSERDYIRVLGLIDFSSGIKDIQFTMTDPKGALIKSGNFEYDSANGYAYLDYKSGLFPSTDLDTLYTMNVIVSDIAGNQAALPSKGMMYDNVTNAPNLLGYFEPDSNNVLGPGLEGFIPYVAGSAVKTNPIKMAFKLPKNNWSGNRAGGIYLSNALGTNTIVGEDVDNVYIVATAPFGNTNGNYLRWNNFGQWGGGGVSYSLTLDDSAPKTPVLTNVEYYIETNDTWIRANQVILYQVSELPLTITKFRVTAQARSYAQNAVHGSSCIIPAGETSCEGVFNASLKDGTTGYLHGNFSIYSVDISTPELMSNPTWGEITWNAQLKPIIYDVVYDQAAKMVFTKVEQPGAGYYFDRLNLKSTVLEYGEGKKLSPVSSLRNGTSYEYSFDLTKIPDGKYQLQLLATDTYGNITTEPVGSYKSDKEAPIIKILNDNSDVFTEIIGLSELTINISDLSSYSIVSAQLNGGPASDNVYLATRPISVDSFALEYPRIYPSLESGDTYQLTVVAMDEYKNLSQKSVSFTYQPPNLLKLGSMSTLSVPQSIKNKLNESVSTVKTGPLRTGEGHLASGPQNIFFTLRSDAQYDIIVGGQRVSAGQTVQFTATPVEDGSLQIDIYPAEGKVGKASFLIDVPEINSSYEN